MSFMVEVKGKYACFTRPEMKVERVSYDVITPSAARGLLEAIYWHPGMRYVIDRMYVLNPIRFTNIRRNEVKSVIPKPSKKTLMDGISDKELYINAREDIQQRAASVLVDVHYVISAHFVMTEQASPSDNEGKFCDIIRRRLEKGQCYHQPYFGCREFPAAFGLWSGDPIPTIPDTRDLGFMLYDMDYSNPEDIQPMFFRASLKNGIVDVRDCEVFR
jgi:CRISPR-associated protein Cas5d